VQSALALLPASFPGGGQPGFNDLDRVHPVYGTQGMVATQEAKATRIGLEVLTIKFGSGTGLVADGTGILLRRARFSRPRNGCDRRKLPRDRIFSFFVKLPGGMAAMEAGRTCHRPLNSP
jgi:hypothetical protein